MADQTNLFDRGLQKEIIRSGRNATPAKPGTGPEGQTCRTCFFRTAITYRDTTYNKCAKMEKAWSHGAGTDIRLKWPACAEWHPGGKTVLAIVEALRAIGWETSVDDPILRRDILVQAMLMEQIDEMPPNKLHHTLEPLRWVIFRAIAKWEESRDLFPSQEATQ